MRRWTYLLVVVGGMACGITRLSTRTTSAAQPDGIDADENLFIQFGDEESRFPMVGLIKKNGYPSCTGVMVGPSTVLTAGHCFSKDQNNRTFELGRQSFTITGGRVHPGYEPGTVHPKDLAIVRIDGTPGTKVGWIDRFPLALPQFGTRVTLVGFGLDEQQIAGVKRSGTMIIQELHPSLNMPVLIPTESKQASCTGDSGGPSFGPANILVGLVSGGPRASCGEKTETIITDANENFVWIDNTRRATDPFLPAKFAITVAEPALAKSCQLLTINLQNQTNAAVEAFSDLTVGLSGQGLTFHSRPGCGAASAISSAVIPKGMTSVQLYFRSATGNRTVALKAEKVEVQAPAKFQSLRITGEKNFAIR